MPVTRRRPRRGSGCPPWSRPAEALGLFLRGATARAAAPVALVVGAVLSAVNQGALIASGQAAVGTWLRVAFNFVVPFVVSSLGYLSAGRVRRHAGEHASDAAGCANSEPPDRPRPSHS